MKSFVLSLFIALGFVEVVNAQNFVANPDTTYPLVTIQEIQAINLDSLKAINGDDAKSPYEGKIVRFQGVVMVAPVASNRKPIMWAGGRWQTYVQSVDGQPFGGLIAIQNDTTAANQATNVASLDSGDVVEFTGTVSEFNTTTQAAILLTPITPISIVGAMDRPKPIVLKLSDFINNGAKVIDAEKYEGMYVEIRNVVTLNRNASSGVFNFQDENGNVMGMTDQSGYFTKRAHRLNGLTDYDAPNDGTTLEYIRGFVQSRLPGGNNLGFYILPAYPGDIKVGTTPTTISSVTRDKGLVKPTDGVKISTVAFDTDGQVKKIEVIYRVNNAAPITAPMTVDPNDPDLYTFTVPAVNIDSAIVDYYIRAVDNNDLVSSNPTDTVRSRIFYQVLNRPLTIADVQYTPVAVPRGGYFGFEVEVEGFVTADSSDINSPTRMYIQDGEGPWTGLWINGPGALTLKRGDYVKVKGKVNEDFNVTRLDSVFSVTKLVTVKPFPKPSKIKTGFFSVQPSDINEWEKWESVLVTYDSVTVTEKSADGASNFGEINVSDGSGKTRIELQEGNHVYHNAWGLGLTGTEINVGDKFAKVTGILYFSFSNYKLLPRKDDDFVGYVPNSLDRVNANPTEFVLEQNYPNPFNPSTTIQFSLAQAGNVSLKVYDVLGQQVAELVNGELSSGSYKVTFDASLLPSGMYIYKIDAPNFTNTKKMLLVK